MSPTAAIVIDESRAGVAEAARTLAGPLPPPTTRVAQAAENIDATDSPRTQNFKPCHFIRVKIQHTDR